MFPGRYTARSRLHTFWYYLRSLGRAYRTSLLLLFFLGSGLTIDASTEPGSSLGYAISYARMGVWLNLALWLGASGLVFLLFGGLDSSNPDGTLVDLSTLEGDDRQLTEDLSADALEEMVGTLAHDIGDVNVSQVLIDESPEPSAMTYTKFGESDVVIIHTNLLEILRPEELRAVLAHELAHAHERHTLRRLENLAPMMLAVAFLGIFFIQSVGGLLDPPSFGVFLSRGLFVLLLGVVSLVLFACLSGLSNAHSRAQERMADLVAAAHAGWLELTNALLRLGERVEAVQTASAAFYAMSLRERDAFDPPGEADALMRVLRRIPAREADQETTRTLVPRLFIHDRLDQLRVHYGLNITEIEIERLATDAASHLAPLPAEKATLVEKHMRTPWSHAPEADGDGPDGSQESNPDPDARLLAWRDYDADQSGHLDAEELDRCVAALRADPQRMLFRSYLHPESRDGTHPSYRERILLLHDAFADEHRSEDSQIRYALPVMHRIPHNTLPSPITLYRASQLLSRELETGVRHEPGVPGQ